MQDKNIHIDDPVRSMALFAELNPEPVFRFDRKGRVLQSNPAANRLFKNKSIPESSVSDLLPDVDFSHIEELIAGDKIQTHTIRIGGRHYSFVFRGISEHAVVQVYGFDITDKVKAQNKAESMALFAQKNPAPVFRFNTEGELLEANEAAMSLFHLVCKKEINIYNFFPEINKEEVQHLIDENEIRSFVENIRSFYYRFELRGIEEMGAVQVYGADITEIVEAHFENEKLSTAIQQSSNTVMITDTEGNIEFVNNAFEKITGYSKEEVIGKNPKFLKTNYHSPEMYKELWNTIKSGKVWKGEFFNRRKNGTKYWEEASITPILDSDGVVRNFIAVKEDITEQKQAQEQLHSMALFAKLNPEPVIRFNNQGIVLQANPAASKSFSRNSIVGMQITELIPQLNNMDIPAFIEKNQIETIDIPNHEKMYRFILKGISEIEVCQIYGSDITKRIEAQKTAESMALFAQLNPEPVFRFDQDGMILQSNPAANEAFKREQLVGEKVNEFIQGVDNIQFKEFIANDKIFTFTEALEDRIFRFKLRGISHLGICQIYGSDITDRVKAEQKVRQQKKDIDDSIQYASRIQNAVLPASNVLNQYFQEHFIIFKPRDVVSGDFYWMKEKENQLVLVAADCTGHGVPGAFMSMLGVSFLNEIVNSRNTLEAGQILNDLRHLVKTTLSQSGESKADGMDLSLVIVDKERMKLQFAGAYNHLYLFRDNQMQIIKADRMPIGNYIGKEKAFSGQEIDIYTDDVFYILSDGYPDQFDDESKRKFGIKRLKEEFAAIHQNSMKDQKIHLEELFENWKGNHWQMDDVLVMGARI